MTLTEMKVQFEKILETLLVSADWNRLNTASINLVSLGVYPWHDYCAVSFRQTREMDELNPAEWEFFESARLEDDKAFSKICEWYKTGDAVIRAHGIFTAAAYALCSEKSVKLIQKYIPFAASLTEDFFPKHFYYMVTDADRTVSFNYCEYIHIRRLDSRLGLFSE